MDKKIEEKSYKPLPTGKYLAQIMDVVELEGDYGPQVKFKFDIWLNETLLNPKLYAWCPNKFHKNSKLYAWTEAALGIPIKEGYIFDPMDLIGCFVLVTVIEINDPDKFPNKIIGVSRFSRSLRVIFPLPEL